MKKDTMEYRTKVKMALSMPLYDFANDETQNVLDWSLGKKDYKEMRRDSEINLTIISERVIDIFLGFEDEIKE